MEEIMKLIESAGVIVIIIGIVILIIKILIICAIIETARNMKRANELIYEMKKELETTNKYLYTVAENQVELAKILKKEE